MSDLKNIILVGMMGSGKSALGRSLALKLGMGFFDFDEWIAAKARKSIAEIFKQDGEERFRQKENEALEFVQHIRNHVVALGGGTIHNRSDWPKISHLGTSVWIHTPIKQVIANLLKNEAGLKQRPILADLTELSLDEKKRVLGERLPALLEQRLSLYKLADLEFMPTERSIRLNTMQLDTLLQAKLAEEENGMMTNGAGLVDPIDVGSVSVTSEEVISTVDSSES